MNLFVFLFSSNFCSLDNVIQVKEIYLLENNYWSEDQNTKNEFLLSVSITLKTKNELIYEYYTKNLCYYDKYNKLYYATLPESVVNEINSIGLSKKYLKFCYTFGHNRSKVKFKNDCKVEQTHEKIDFKGVELFENHKLIKKSSINDAINLIGDGVELRMCSIKNIFIKFIHSNWLRFDIKSYKSYEKKLKESVGLKLYYFESPSLCLENLKRFFESLNYLKLVDDSRDDVKIDYSNTLKLSYFLEKLIKRFDKDFNKEKNNAEDLILFFKECRDHLKNGLMSNNIFLPITDEYDPCFYLDKFYSEINTAITDLKNSKEPKSCDLTFTNLFKFSRSIEKLQEFYITEVCESEFVQKQLSSVIGKKVENIEDYIEIEKILCDYCNVFTTIINNNLLYLKPFFNENYNCRIVKGIKIDFEKPAEFGKMFAYGFDGKEVILENDVDYFIDNSGDVFFLSDKIRKRNLYEIVVMSLDGKCRKRFEVDDYLNK